MKREEWTRRYKEYMLSHGIYDEQEADSYAARGWRDAQDQDMWPENPEEAADVELEYQELNPD